MLLQFQTNLSLIGNYKDFYFGSLKGSAILRDEVAVIVDSLSRKDNGACSRFVSELNESDIVTNQYTQNCTIIRE
jgi:hypothetical protein